MSFDLQKKSVNLQKQIDMLNKEKLFLQEEIQDIINKLKKNKFIEKEKESLNNEKNTRLIRLNNIIAKIKEIQFEKNKNTDYINVCRQTDSLIRLKNKSNSTEIINNLKEQRNKANEEYFKNQSIEKEYSEKDAKEIPAFLFFNQNIINKYGICPFIKILDVPIEEVIQNRKNWLNLQDDNGKLYYDLYDKICLLKDKNLLEEELKSLDSYFDKIHKSILNEKNLELFDISINYIIEYLNCQIKTKKIKDKFKIVINNLSIIVNELDIPIHEYLNEKYNIPLQINNFNLKEKIANVISFECKMIKDDYINALNKYKQIKEDIKKDYKYTKNVTNNLKQLLCDFLLNKKNSNTVTEIKQEGKYFKKWSLLNLIEKSDRLESFSKMFVNNFLVNTNLIETNLKDKFINDLSKLLIDSLNSKELIYKNIKWNINIGIIEKINNLKYDNDIKKFNLVNSLKKDTKNKIKKLNSIKSILTIQNEKLINEELLLFIIQFIQSGKVLNENNSNSKINTKETNDTFNLKEKCIQHLKLKLKFKRLSTDDKNKIYKKFDEMYNLIKANQPSENTTESNI